MIDFILCDNSRGSILSGVYFFVQVLDLRCVDLRSVDLLKMSQARKSHLKIDMYNNYFYISIQCIMTIYFDEIALYNC